jgi:CDP-paratose 2-epimerase
MKVFVTGGAGFIGSNVAMHHITKGDHVTILDNLSRKGGDFNLSWLKKPSKHNLHFVKNDVRNYRQVVDALPRNADIVYHFAGQVAVTTSVLNPRDDFESNAAGTINLLEAVRSKAPEAIVCYSSTNKVYGGMEDLGIVEDKHRYRYRNLRHGIPESQPLDFHSPYGCSKGCGDQYMLDYARIYGMRTIVFRQSCIYGTSQFGMEDQGWVAHLCIAAKLGRRINIYGNGKQVRDVLWIGDLVSAFEHAVSRISKSAGQCFNIGGGMKHTISVWGEFGPLLEDLAGRPLAVKWAGWRPGDQRIYVSDIRKAARVIGWHPTVSFEKGLERLWRWVSDNVKYLR